MLKKILNKNKILKKTATQHCSQSVNQSADNHVIDSLTVNYSVYKWSKFKQMHQEFIRKYILFDAQLYQKFTDYQ